MSIRCESRRIGWGFALAIAVLAALGGEARADDHITESSKRMAFRERRGKLEVSVRFTELFDSRAYKRLESGFPTTVSVRVAVYRKKGAIPVAFALKSYRVVYDLWEEAYTVREEGAIGQRNRRYGRRAEALKAITRVIGLPIAPLSRIQIGPHYYAVVVLELNPVSEELLAEMRRWLSKPAGDAKLDASSSFFGSFVSVFANPKIEEADRVMKIRSQPFYRVRSRKKR